MLKGTVYQLYIVPQSWISIEQCAKREWISAVYMLEIARVSILQCARLEVYKKIQKCCRIKAEYELQSVLHLGLDIICKMYCIRLAENGFDI